LGAIGLTTGVDPSLTLGPGGVGGAITGDNITVHHLYNVKRLAYEVSPPPETALRPGTIPVGSSAAPDPQKVEKVVREVVDEILGMKNP